MVKNLPANAADVGLIPGLGRSPGEGNGKPLLYSCLGNPMDRGAWQATVHDHKRFGYYLASKQEQPGKGPGQQTPGATMGRQTSQQHLSSSMTGVQGKDV